MLSRSRNLYIDADSSTTLDNIALSHLEPRLSVSENRLLSCPELYNRGRHVDTIASRKRGLVFNAGLFLGASAPHGNLRVPGVDVFLEVALMR